MKFNVKVESIEGVTNSPDQSGKEALVLALLGMEGGSDIHITRFIENSESPQPDCSKNNVIVGQSADSKYNNCILIGNGLEATEDYQLVIGNSVVKITRRMTEEEFELIYDTFRSITQFNR